MEDAVVNVPGSGLVNEPNVSSNESVSMEEVHRQSDWTLTRMITGGDTSGSEEPFEMAPIRCEISTLSHDDHV